HRDLSRPVRLVRLLSQYFYSLCWRSDRSSYLSILEVADLRPGLQFLACLWDRFVDSDPADSCLPPARRRSILYPGHQPNSDRAADHFAVQRCSDPLNLPADLSGFRPADCRSIDSCPIVVAGRIAGCLTAADRRCSFVRWLIGLNRECYRAG